MKINFFNRSNLLITFTSPNILLYSKDEDGYREYGPYITDLNTGIFYNHYDYGYVLKIQFLGFGIDAWWMV